MSWKSKQGVLATYRQFVGLLGTMSFEQKLTNAQLGIVHLKHWTEMSTLHSADNFHSRTLHVSHVYHKYILSGSFIERPPPLIKQKWLHSAALHTEMRFHENCGVQKACRISQESMNKHYQLVIRAVTNHWGISQENERGHGGNKIKTWSRGRWYMTTSLNTKNFLSLAQVEIRHWRIVYSHIQALNSLIKGNANSIAGVVCRQSVKLQPVVRVWELF